MTGSGGGPSGDGLSEHPPGSRKRRIGLTVAVVLGSMLLLGTVGAVADMIVQSTSKARDEVHPGGPVRLQARNFAFLPPSVVLRGQGSVTVIVTNDGVSEHSFTMDRFGIDLLVEPGQSASATVRPAEPGVYQFYCRFHENYGMRGEIRFGGNQARD